MAETATRARPPHPSGRPECADCHHTDLLHGRICMAQACTCTAFAVPPPEPPPAEVLEELRELGEMR